MTLRALIADDEAPARRKLERFLLDAGDVEVVAQASNGIDAVDLVALTRPDVVFLDIHMPDLDGIGVAEALASSERPPWIVFVTAYDAYAVAAFDVNAVDYLLKPYDRQRFVRALERARAAGGTDAQHDPARLASALARARNDGEYARRLLVTREGRSAFVPVEDLLRVESEGNNVVLLTRRGRYELRATLESIEARLDPQLFARIHRSHVVAIDEIAEIHPWFRGDFKVRMRDGAELTWSRRYAVKRPDLLKTAP